MTRVLSEGELLLPLDTVAVVAMGHSAKAFTSVSTQLWAAPNTEIWGVKDAGVKFRTHLIFDMHDFLRWDSQIMRDRMEKDFRVYEKLDCPVVVCEPHLPWMSRYPIEKIWERFRTTYFESVTAYMFALAVYRLLLTPGKKTLMCYGTDFQYKDLMEPGRANAEFWLGIASAAGISVLKPAASEIMGNGKPYGYGRRADVSGDSLVWLPEVTL